MAPPPAWASSRSRGRSASLGELIETASGTDFKRAPKYIGQFDAKGQELTVKEFFVTALTTSFLKLPFFEGINAFCAAMPIYEAYVPTAIRDIVYGIARNCCTIAVLSAFPQWTVASPQTLLIVVILGCLSSAPFKPLPVALPMDAMLKSMAAAFRGKTLHALGTLLSVSYCACALFVGSSLAAVHFLAYARQPRRSPGPRS